MSEEEDTIYYKIYLDHESELLTVVCMQYFDEQDYVPHRFLMPDGQSVKFSTEEEAIAYLNANVPYDKIEPEYRSANAFLKAPKWSAET